MNQINIDEISDILYEEYVNRKAYSIVDRMSRVTHKETAIQVLYDAIRGITDEEKKKKFKEFIDSVTGDLEKGDFYQVKLVALKALTRG
ncbi:MAG TPA: hypothetical protein VKU94_07150 [Geobacterales bacterium]|nr:hypothetical protein [Geobacterales bacterium]